MKLRITSDNYMEHFCPGCRIHHQIAVYTPFPNGQSWTWNGDHVQPTFRPSIHIKVGPYVDDDTGETVAQYTSCHYFITTGLIQFCSDSAHSLAGTTVELPDLPEKPNGPYIS